MPRRVTARSRLGANGRVGGARLTRPTGWEKAQLVFGRDLGVTPWFAGISAGVFVLLLLLYLIKLAFFSQSVVGELRHPVKLNFFPTISA